MGFYPPHTSMPVEVDPQHPALREDAASDLPGARLLGGEPSDRQVRWTMRVVWLVLIVLVLVCAIGPHIPSGE